MLDGNRGRQACFASGYSLMLMMMMMMMMMVVVVVGPPRLVSERYQRRRVLRAGVNLRLACPVESPPPPPLVTWTKDDETVHPGWERYHVDPHSDVLTVRDVGVEDSGVFVCQATNGFGTIDVRFLVYVHGQLMHVYNT